MFSSMFRYLLVDTRHAFRGMARAPAFFATLLFVLALGIGATTAMFSLVECLLLRPLPYPRPAELTMVWATQPQVDPSPVSIPDFVDWRKAATSFERMTAVESEAYTLTSEGAAPENLPGASVSGDFFPMFGLAPLHGRFFGNEDDRVDAPKTVVISEGLFQRRFAGDPRAVGTTVTLNGVPYILVGVAPVGFRFSAPFSDRTDLWTPLAASHVGYAAEAVSGRGSHFLQVMGRRKPGVSLAQAEAELKTIAKTLEVANPDTNTRVSVRVEDLHDSLVGSSRSGVWVLFASVGLVFLVVCANVGNLLLTRAGARRGEMAARAALGATSTRLAAQIVTETVVVFLVGAALGAFLARFMVSELAGGLVEQAGAMTIPVAVDMGALTFAVVLSLVSGLVFGLVPAFAVARVEPQAVLKEAAARAGTSQSQKTTRSGLVVVQVALAFALLVGSGLSLRAFDRVAKTPTGLVSEDVATARVFLSEASYRDSKRVVRFYDDLLARVAREPGVLSTAAGSTLPFCGSNSNGSFRIEGRPAFPPGERPLIERNVVTPGYFETLGIPVLRGRAITAEDRAEGRLVIVVSQTMVDRFFPGEDPIGRRIDWGDNETDERTWREIVGVVGDVRRRSLERPPAAETYVPLAQKATRWMIVAAHTRPNQASALLERVPQMVREIDPQEAPASRKLLSERVADSFGNRKHVTALLAAFAGTALVLATLGLFGLVSYSTGQRTRELGLRMALGATPEGVVGMVVAGGVKLLAAGMAVGVVLAIVVGKILSARLSGIVATDALVYATIPVVLGVAGVLACLVPAIRAVRIPAAVALRYEG